ncbi:uncharacterized protein LOC117650394 [Thrips palmi]|uniref:Uncharacterized protein LOC117650394 n=1 Tax=Thrips palmi TaxID=161013 RepID=A0A6P8ZWD1_THRPL|nr:uncharacterized protein LOC117650394 [Thrips palmi]
MFMNISGRLNDPMASDSEDSEISDLEEVLAGDELSENDINVVDASGEATGESHGYAVKIQQRAAEFLTFIKQECVTTQVTIDNVVRGVDDLFHLYNKFLKARIFELSETDLVKKQDIESLFAYMNQQTIFEGVQTKYRLEKYQRANWDALVPEQVVYAWKKILLHGKVRQVPAKFGYYVDFLKQLESILQCKDILNCVDNPKPPSSIFKSALDGYVYQNHPVVQKHPSASNNILLG